MSHKNIYYSEKYYDDKYEYRHVVLPKELAKLVPKTHLMSEDEWRLIGVQQSRGWIHYMTHKPDQDSNVLNALSMYKHLPPMGHIINMVLKHVQRETVLKEMVPDVLEPHILLFKREITTPPSEQNGK